MGKVRKWSQEAGFKDGSRYDIQDSARGLKIGEGTLKRYVREGKIEVVRGGPPYFIRGETLKNFIPQLRPQGRPREKNLSQKEGELKC